jgi:hypothetical protein
LFSGVGEFALEENAGAVGTSFGKGESVASADCNLDGSLDLLVTNGKTAAPFDVGPLQLFLGIPNGNHWIEIDLIGVIDNVHGIGCKVS